MAVELAAEAAAALVLIDQLAVAADVEVMVVCAVWLLFALWPAKLLLQCGCSSRDRQQNLLCVATKNVCLCVCHTNRLLCVV